MTTDGFVEIDDEQVNSVEVSPLQGGVVLFTRRSSGRLILRAANLLASLVAFVCSYVVVANFRTVTCCFHRLPATY